MNSFYEAADMEIAHVLLEEKIPISYQKGLETLNFFTVSVEKLAGKKLLNNEKISATKGDITSYDKFSDLEKTMEFVTKNKMLNSIKLIQNLGIIFNYLVKYKQQYQAGYEKEITIIKMEYESLFYMFATGLSLAIASYVQVNPSGGTSIRVTVNPDKRDGLIVKSIDGFAKELKNRKHVEYLNNLIKAKMDAPVEESVYYEEPVSTVGGTLAGLFGNSFQKIFVNVLKYFPTIVKLGVDFFVKVKNTMFGIIPLIRIAIFIRYRNKVNTIFALEDQIELIKNNITQLKNNPDIPNEKKEIIIKKQEAYIRAYEKKSAKLRAFFADAEGAAERELKSENTKAPSDDFIL